VRDLLDAVPAPRLQPHCGTSARGIVVLSLLALYRHRASFVSTLLALALGLALLGYGLGGPGPVRVPGLPRRAWTAGLVNA